MIPLDKLNQSILCDDNAIKFLNSNEYDEFKSISETEKLQELKNILTSPINKFTSINELYFRNKWADLIGKIYGNNPVVLLEVASGDADMIPQALSRSNIGSTYIAANMNKELNRSLLSKTTKLNLKFQLIDDDAAQINQYLNEKAIDIIAFQHGVNDVLQAILCSQEGIDTVNSGWMDTLPIMIKLLQKEIKANTFENNVKTSFLKLINNLLLTLKDDGIIMINHYMFQLDLDWGYPSDLFENLIPMIRLWFKNDTELKEVRFPGFEPQWWIFLKK
jgi:hypothetical protein